MRELHFLFEQYDFRRDLKEQAPIFHRMPFMGLSLIEFAEDIALRAKGYDDYPEELLPQTLASTS